VGALGTCPPSNPALLDTNHNVPKVRNLFLLSVYFNGGFCGMLIFLKMSITVVI